MPFRMRVAAVALLALTAVACGGGDDPSVVADAPGASTTAVPTPQTMPPETKPTTTAAPEPKPTVSVPAPPAPTTLQITDLVVGTGPQVKTGDTVSMRYIGVDFDSHREFDSNWDSGRPFTFTVGAGNVIAGWDEGIPGMRVGGRRHLVIPPDKAYGDAGAGGVIKPGATLVFLVEALSVQPS